jgi:hypothetical protein
MRLFHTGFGMGSIDVFDLSASGMSIASDFPRNGTYCANNSGGGGGQISIASADSEFWGRCAFRWNGPGFSNSAFIYLANAAAGPNMCRIGVDGTNHWTMGDAGGTQRIISGAIATSGVYHLIEFHAKFAAVGTLELKVDGTLIGTYSGDTRGGGTLTTIDRLGISTGAADGRWDDIALNDSTTPAADPNNNSWVGEGHCVTLVPNGAGDHTGLTIGGSSPAATNWQGVDETPPNDGTDFNEDASAPGTDVYDLYALSDPSNVGAVNAIMTWVRAQKDAAGIGNFRFVHKIGGTEYRDAADIALLQSWARFRQLRALNPNTAAPWTAADLNALQAGFDAR